MYCKKGLSVSKIAKYFNCGQTTIVSKIHAFGITSRRRVILLSAEVLEELYYNQKLEQAQIGKLLWCDQATISIRMREAGIKARDKSETSTKYPKYDFSGKLIEKAYMIGFRLGDLHVRKHRYLISVEGTTTRPEQIALIKGLFEKYGHVRINTNNKGKTSMACLLNSSFDFLLQKNDTIPNWILETDYYFLAFLAGYTDAEGCIGTYRNKGSRYYTTYILRTYDKNILLQIWQKLSSLNISCPKPYICTPKGKYDNNKDFWKLGVHKKSSLRRLFGLITPYVKHPRIINGVKKSKQVIK